MKQTLRTMIAIGVGLLVMSGCASGNEQQQEAEAKKKATQQKLRKSREMRKNLKAEKEKMQTQLEEVQEELEATRELAAERKALNDQLTDQLSSVIEAGRAEVTSRRGMLMVRVPRDVLFASGKFELTDQGKETLREVASALDNMEGRRLLVAGHTDNVPVSKKAVSFKDNWELSAKRAMRSLKVMANAGLDKSKMGAAGFASYDPIASNDTEKGRMKNRRVEIVMVPNLSKVMKTAKMAKQAARSVEQ